MNQQVRESDSGDTFESAIAQLLEQIRKTKWAKSQLDVIVADGLKVVKKIDDSYRNDGSFTKFRLYLLYKIAFEVWSYQHQAILESIQLNKHEQFPTYSQLVVDHRHVLMNMFDELDKIANVNDPDRLRNVWLSVWKQTLNKFEQFLQIPLISPIIANKPKIWRLGKILSKMSPTTKYVILTTFLLLLAILIATKLLIR